MRIKKSIPVRHKCSEKKDKTGRVKMVDILGTRREITASIKLDDCVPIHFHTRSIE